MTITLDSYREVAGDAIISHLRQLASLLKGSRVVHVNSTRHGGGVSEILERMVPLMNELGLDATWEVIEGSAEFYDFTKTVHNGLQGNRVALSRDQRNVYKKINADNAADLKDKLNDADFVIIHDPQPAALHSHFPNRKGKWVWRCHIDVSRPDNRVWKFLRQYVKGYDASIWSLPEFAKGLPHTQYLIPPSIDPLSDKNRELSTEQIQDAYKLANVDPDRPIVLQVSRFDHFKDPLGVIEAFRLARKYMPLQLVLAGGEATDDPEGEEVLADVRASAADDPDIHILLLPSNADIEINALQRIADIVIQKSTKEGFGLTVTEGMWKGKPVIGGAVGGIKLQVIDHHTGFLVHSPEGAALRMKYLFMRPEKISEMGTKAREYVRDNFLLTRHLREYLTLMVAISRKSGDRINLQS
jgi:trehalose synthase